MHLHPEWLELAGDANPLAGRTGRNMHDFTEPEQVELLGLARDELVRAIEGLLHRVADLALERRDGGDHLEQDARRARDLLLVGGVRGVETRDQDGDEEVEQDPVAHLGVGWGVGVGGGEWGWD